MRTTRRAVLARLGAAVVATTMLVGGAGAAGATPQPAAAVQEGGGETTPDERYVTRVYKDLFGRWPDKQGLEHWTAGLANGVPRIEVANAITGSDEYRTGLIKIAYHRYLDRKADQAGVQYWLQRMRDGLTIQQLEAGFVASEEFITRACGSYTPGAACADWVKKLYKNVLERHPKDAEVGYWLSRLDGSQPPRLGHVDVAMGFLLSTERLSTDLDRTYKHLLGRHIDATGRAHWVTQIQQGVRYEQVIGGIIASEEYYAKH